MDNRNPAQFPNGPDAPLSFVVRLDPQNRWMRLARVMPWDYIDEVYTEPVSTETGRPAYPARLAFALLFISRHEGLSQESFQGNPYKQYFAGVNAFTGSLEISSSSLTDFAKRFPEDIMEQVYNLVGLENIPEEFRDMIPSAADA